MSGRRLQVGLERGLSEEGGAGGPDEVHRDPEQPIDRGSGENLFQPASRRATESLGEWPDAAAGPSS